MIPWLERQRENGTQTLPPKVVPSVDHVWRDKGKITDKLCSPQVYPWNKKLGCRSLQNSSGGRWELLALSGKLQPCSVCFLRFLSAAVVVHVCDVSAAAHCLLSCTGLSQGQCCCLQAVGVLQGRKKWSLQAAETAPPRPDWLWLCIADRCCKVHSETVLFTKCSFSGCYICQSSNQPKATPFRGRRETKENRRGASACTASVLSLQEGKEKSQNQETRELLPECPKLNKIGTPPAPGFHFQPCCQVLKKH